MPIGNVLGLTNNSKMNDIAKQSDIIGTIQTVTYNTDDTVQKIEHRDSTTNALVRTDAFTYEANLITEVRTLAIGGTLTYKYHTDTKQTEVI